MTTTHQVDHDEREASAPSELSGKTVPTVTSPSLRRGFGVVTAVLLVLALAVAAASLYVSMMQRNEMTQQLKTVRDSMQTLKTQHAQTIEEMRLTQRAMDASQRQLTAFEQQMQAEMQQQSYQANDWVLLKARYYLELAQINAHWGDNLSTTSALLVEADRLLQNNHQQRLFEVRKAIAEENNQVVAIPPVDLIGLLTQLDVAQDLVNQLVAKTVQPSGIANLRAVATATPETAVKPSWRDRLNDSVKRLGQLVVIRHIEGDMQAPLAEVSLALLREQLRLVLQETQVAVLQKNQALYQLTLKQAIKLITQAFDVQDKATQMLLNQLQRLQQETILQEQPDLKQALDLLNQVIDEQKNKVPPSPSAGASKS